MVIESRRGSAAQSSIPLLFGLGIQALTTYLVLVIAGRSIGTAHFGALSALYVLITSIATGLFLPLEQEVARRRGDERGRTRWDPTLLGRAIRLGLMGASASTAVALGALPLTLDILGQQPQLVVALVVALPGYALCFATRGEMAGRGEFLRYGVQLSVEGLVRIGGAIALVIGGLHTASWYGWLFAIAPWCAVGVSSIGWRRAPGPGRRQRGGPLLAATGLLVASSLSSQLLINAGPLVVALLATESERGRIGVFLAALVVVRIPVFLFTAVAPSFLPAMAEHASADRYPAFVRLVRRVMGGCLVVVVVAGLFATAVGGPVERWLFGFQDELSRWTYFVLTLSVGLFVLATVFAQSLLGLGKHGNVALGWLTGLCGLTVGTALGNGAIGRASTGFLVGALLATAVMGALLVGALRRWRTAHLNSLSSAPWQPGTLASQQ